MHGMSLIVKNITRVIAAFIAMFGLYIVMYGHVSPGGGFTGGVIIGCGFVLAVLAFGIQGVRKIFPPRAVSIADCLGALGFLVVAVLGYLAGGFFVRWLAKGDAFSLLSAGTIPLSNIAVGIKVGACLYGAFEVLSIFRPQRRSPGGTFARPVFRE
jgi:multicomponent Na+:H+ antiporter subunit B